MKDEPNKITATLKVVVSGEFYDDEASEETLRYCVEQDLEDAGFDVNVELLKEQEPVEIETEGGGTTWWYVCEECRGSVGRGDRFCRHCGRPFKPVKTGGCNGCAYKGSEDCQLGFVDSGNFYCPNGKLI